MSPRNRHRRPAGRAWLRPGIILLVAVLIALGIATAATKLLANAKSSTQPGAGSTAGSSGGKPACPELVLPAYFTDWSPVFSARPAPADIILDPPNGINAGPAPDAGITVKVGQAKSAGTTILGYTSTQNGAISVADVEASALHYKQWYGVTHIYLDVVAGDAAHLAYYQQIAAYIHQLDGPGSVWLNAGFYPDQSYMSFGDVVNVFEGSYPQYLTAQVPSWAGSYPAAKFAHTIYATVAADLASALRLAAERHAAHVFVTDEVEPDPYAGLPSYWPREIADSCQA